uniref:N-acetylneuraminate lyase n=1 Tax=Salarias fasciatus TaxID=181472 RepID=A0A672ISH1_SALFA
VSLRYKKNVIKISSLNGTTGESMSLSVEERKKLAEEWCKRGHGKLEQVIVHVGSMSVKESKELARHAAEIGVDGIAVISPSFFKPKTAGALRTFLQEVASAAPNLPFYFYHLPAFTGVNIPARDVLEGIEQLIPSFRGVKFSGNDLMDFGLCASYSQPSWSLLYGVDEQLLSALVIGANGAVGSTYNYVGCHIKNLMSAFENGDLVQAKAIQFKLQELLKYAVQVGFDVGVNKQLMSEISGLTLGPPRLPVEPCSSAHAQSIKQKLISIFA